MKLALLGTGLMGYPMAEKLLEAGYQLCVYNRTIEKALPLEQAGAKVVSTSAEAIEQSDVAILMLTDANAISEVLFSPKSSISFSQKTIIQMGTILPEESLQFESRICSGGGVYLEAPVLGSTPNVIEKSLFTMVGADSKEDFDKFQPIFNAFSKAVYYVGPVGKAAALKLALNQLIASLASAFSLSLGLILKEEIDVDLFMDILRKSALYAPTFDKKLNRMLERNFSNPNFPAKHLLKDVQLVSREVQKCGLHTSLVQSLIEILQQTITAGHGEEDYSVLFNTICPQ
ncbi:MAG: NAD(P)-dependent oxidoreductase [Calditrichaeota bacterium]|nr:MAG: NAD(P)-dependent oxidoreductase [Calditrichota bacterium]